MVVNDIKCGEEEYFSNVNNVFLRGGEGGHVIKLKPVLAAADICIFTRFYPWCYTEDLSIPTLSNILTTSHLPVSSTNG